MSSATSTSPASDGLGLPAEPARGPASSTLQPWQFFVLVALVCATGLTWIVRGQGVTTVVLVTVLIGAVALVALATLRVVRPLVLPADDRTPVVGEWTRAALEREKQLTLRSIKELEFDRSMGKISEDDFHEMGTRLRARAARLIRQLDAGVGYRAKIEQDVVKRLGVSAESAPAASRDTTRMCTGCNTPNDADAKFCKACGTKL